VSKPVIGIVPGFIIDKSQSAVHIDYADAVEAGGGLPIIIPTIMLKSYHAKIVELCAGILITGSNSDVNPQAFHQEKLKELVVLNSVREEFDRMILNAVFKKKVPLWGICYGHQEINVFLGGSLYQDIARQVPNHVQHQQSPPHHLPIHPVSIKEKSFLHKLTGTKEIQVNSRHHQAIDALAPGLIPVAHSPDGLNEAYILDSKKHCVLGVQWHPESMWRTDAHALNLFIYFIKQCALFSAHQKK